MQTTMIVLGLLIVAVGIIIYTARAKMRNTPLVADNEHILTLTDVDVSRNYRAAGELFLTTGQEGVPQTDIDGRVVIGFNQSRLK